MKPFALLGLFALTLATAIPASAFEIREACVDAYDSGGYTVTVARGNVASVAVVGDGDTDLDLVIYDSDGDVVAADTDRTDRPEVAWRAGRTETFTIEIRNLGEVYNCFMLGAE